MEDFSPMAKQNFDKIGIRVAEDIDEDIDFWIKIVAKEI